jgi:hypothetical protein
MGQSHFKIYPSAKLRKKITELSRYLPGNKSLNGEFLCKFCANKKTQLARVGLNH